MCPARFGTALLRTGGMHRRSLMLDANRNRGRCNRAKDRRGGDSLWGSPLSLRCRCKWSPQFSPRLLPGTTLFVDMPAEIVTKILQRTLQRLNRPRCKGAECVSRGKELGLKGERVKVLTASFPLLHRLQNLFCPRQTAPAWRTPAA